MKKILIPFICILLALAGCSDNSNSSETPDNVNNFIGEGFKQTLILLVEANRFTVEEAFIENTLTVDKNDTVKENGKTYYRVISDRFSSAEAIYNYIKAAYTDEKAEEIISSGIYADINGKLYCSKNNTKTSESESKQYAIECISKTEDKCVFTAKPEKGKKAEMTAILVDGKWKLEDIYTKI